MKKILLLAALAASVPCSAQISMSIGPITHYNDQHGGRNGWPNNGRYFDGDTHRATWCSDNKTYVVLNDGLGPNASLSGGRNLFIGTMSDYTNPAGGALFTVTNSMDDYGQITQLNTNGWSDSSSWKTGGLHCQGGAMYMSVYRQAFPALTGSNGSLVKSLDNGLTWCSPSHTNHTTGACTITPSATGDAPTNGQEMFQSTGLRDFEWIQYAKDGGTGPSVVERNDEFVYMYGEGATLSDLYLARVRIADLPKLDASLYQYYKGGTCTADSSWDIPANKVGISGLAGTSNLVGPAIYIASSGYYVIELITSAADAIFLKSRSACGPYSTMATIPSDPAIVQAWFYPTLKSMVTANGVTTMVWGSGAGTQHRTSDPDTNQYAWHFNTMTFTSPVTITNVRQDGATPREVVLRYTSPSNTACTAEVSESPTFTPLIHDVDPALFAGSNSDFRNGVQGRERTFIIGAAGLGINYAPVALNGYKTSRAMQANTDHYYRLTCVGDVITGKVRTANIASGITYPAETAPIDPARLGETAWPFLPWDGSQGVIDPITGVYIQLFRKMNERVPSQFGLGTQPFSYVYDDSGTWTNPGNILVDDGSLTTTTANNPIRVYAGAAAQQNIVYTTLTGLTLNVHGFKDASGTTAAACISIDGATCYGPFIPLTGLPVGSLGATINVGDPAGSSGQVAPMLGAWLNTGQRVPDVYETVPKSGQADNVGSTVTMRAYSGGRGSFDGRWTTATHFILNGVDYTVLTVNSGTEIVISGTPSTKTISAATNANPSVITITGHGYVDGDSVTVSGAAGNTAINGTWLVANATANTFTMTDSTANRNPVNGNGVYSGSGTAISNTWHAANFGFLIKKTSGGGTLSIDSATVTFTLSGTHQTNGGQGGSKQCTTKRYPEGWRIGGPAGGTTNAATNTAPIVMTTTSVNDLQTGDVVTQVDVPGNTAANGSWTITRLTSQTYSLNGSDGTASGTYPSDATFIASDLGSGLVWKNNAPTGHFCTVADESSDIVMYWINPDSTPVDARYLGIGYTYVRGQAGVSGLGPIDEAGSVPDAYRMFTVGLEQELFKGRYKGNQQYGMFRAIPTYDSSSTNNDVWAWTSLTPAPNTVTAKLTAFDSTSTEQFFGISGFPKPGLLAISGRAGGIQNSMLWMGIYDVVNNAVLGLMNSWKNANARYCGVHTFLPWPGADYVQFVPYELGGTDSGSQADWKGPYRLFPTAGGLSATPTDCATQLTAISQANPLNITGSQCTTVTTTNVLPITPSNFIPANDTRFNTGIRVGDYFSINTASGGPGGIGNFDNERVRLIGLSGTTLVLQRGASGTTASVHSAGWNMNEYCAPGVTPVWWDFVNAPHGETGTDPYSQGLNGIFQDPPFTGGSHFFTRNGLTVIDSPDVGAFNAITPPATCPNVSGSSQPYFYRNYPWPNHLLAPTASYGCTQGNPEFDTHTGNGNGDNIEKHPSPIDNLTINPSFLDARPYQPFPPWLQTVSKVGTYVYKVTGFNEFQTLDEKRNRAYVAAGHRPSYDVSASGFTLPDTAPYNYTHCLVHVAGECWSGSAVGEVYMNVPFASKVPAAAPTDAGTYKCNVKGELWSDLQLNDICVAIQSPDAENIVQYSVTHDPFNTGSRRITGGLNAPRTSNNLWNAPPLPNGDWSINWGGIINESRYVSTLVKVPPYPGPQRGINHSSWIPIPVKLTSVPIGTATVTAEYGYNPNFECASRKEICVAVNSSITSAPYYYAADTYSRLACSSGCTVVVPALAQRIMWMRVKYWNSGGAVIKTGETQVLVTP